MINVERLPPALTRSVAVAAAAVCSFACLVHLSSYGPSSWSAILDAAAFSAFGLIFPLFFVAIVLVTIGRIPLDQLLGALPLWIKVAGAVVAAYVFVDFFAMVSLVPGQPVEQGAAYFLNNHGSLTPISEATYRQDLMYGARLFSGHAIIFSGMATLVAFQIDRIRRGHLPLDLPISRSMPASQLPAPFSRSVSFRTQLSPQACAERLKPHIARSYVWGWTFGRRAQGALVGSASEEGFRLSIPYGNTSGMVSANGIFEVRDGVTVVHEVIAFKRLQLLGMLGSIPIMLVAVFIVFHGLAGPFAFLAVGSLVVTAFNVGIGLREMNRLQSTIGNALAAGA